MCEYTSLVDAEDNFGGPEGVHSLWKVRNETAIPSVSGDPKATRLSWTKLRRMLETHSVLATLRSFKTRKKFCVSRGVASLKTNGLGLWSPYATHFCMYSTYAWHTAVASSISKLILNIKTRHLYVLPQYYLKGYTPGGVHTTPKYIYTVCLLSSGPFFFKVFQFWSNKILNMFF
jgi:hypothetical protein